MVLTDQQIEELQKAAEPLIKYLAENFHPHVKVIVEQDRAEILESSATVITKTYIKD